MDVLRTWNLSVSEKRHTLACFKQVIRASDLDVAWIGLEHVDGNPLMFEQRDIICECRQTIAVAPVCFQEDVKTPDLRCLRQPYLLAGDCF